MLRKGFELPQQPQIMLPFEGPLALLTVQEIYDRASAELKQSITRILSAWEIWKVLYRP